MLNSLSLPPAIAAPIPCLVSRPDCLTQLTEGAIAQSLELKTLDERLQVNQERIRQQRRSKWKTWIQPNLIGLVANVLGGGDAQKLDLAIADLELKTDELRRRRSEVEGQIGDQVRDLVLEVEQRDRRLAVVRTRQAEYRQKLAVMEVSYRTGQGSTSQMMGLWQQGDDLQANLSQAESDRLAAMQKLLNLTGYDSEPTQ